MADGNPIQMNILIIDDEPVILRNLENHLTTRGHAIFTAERGDEGVKVLESQDIDVVITDVKMPGMDGFEVLRHVKQHAPETEVIMATAFGDIDTAVQAMRDGAFDFFSRPIKLRELVASLHRTERFHVLKKDNTRYREQLDRIGDQARQQYGLSAIIGDSPGIGQVRELIQQVSQTEATTVLIQGETGTGKELVARAIHYESARAGGPFIPVDCSSIPESLIESEFYGHEKGAFTDARESRKGHFELANGGTLFLDEIGDMDLGMQTRLLRTLEERRIRSVGGSREVEVDVRVVSATNKNLSEAIEDGTFRQDLYYRLNTFTIPIPPLRERPGDTLNLGLSFLEQFSREMRKEIAGFSPEAGTCLDAHDFPGNVRELRNMIERAVILCKGDHITPEDLSLQAGTGTARETVSENGPVSAIEQEENLNIDTNEIRLIRLALHKTGGNRVQAAKLLGVSRTSLRRRMERYNIRVLEGESRVE